jgi:hypothetical protein
MDADDIAGFDEFGGRVGAGPIHVKVTVLDKLPRLSARFGHSHPIDHVIQPAFQNRQEHPTGQPFAALSDFKVTPELLFQDTINAARFLLFSQLQTIVGRAASLELPRLAMLAWRVRALFDCALGRQAATAFQEQFLAFPATQFTHWPYHTSHASSC